MNNSWPLDSMGLNCTVTRIWKFFHQCTVSPLHSWLLHLGIYPTADWGQYFHSAASSSCCAGLYTLFYAILYRGLSVHGFWYPQGPKTNLPADTEGWLSFGGVKSYTQIFDCMGVGIPNRHVVQGSTVLLRHLILTSIYTDFKW